MLDDFFKKFFKCTHRHAALDSNEGYCPDCGEYVRKSYYVVKCDCCGIKRIAKGGANNIKPAEKFCRNCGSVEYRVEKYEKLSLTDIYYALEVKETAAEFGESENIEIWVEKPATNFENGMRGSGESLPPLIGNLKYLTG